MFMNEKKLWSVTYAETGPCDPDGFYCPACIEQVVRDQDKKTYAISLINPENSPKYECDLCKVDYRDL